MKKNNAFSLIEIILYIGLVSVIVVSLTTFLIYYAQAKNKSSTIEEVNQQAVYISSYLEQLIRDSDGILLPAKTTSASTMTLTSAKFSSRSPIVVSVASGKIYVSEAGTEGVQISSSKVSISNLSFTNLSQSGTNGNIRYQFQISYINTNGLNEFNYVQTFYGASSTR